MLVPQRSIRTPPEVDPLIAPDAPLQEVLDRLTQDVAKALATPIAILSYCIDRLLVIQVEILAYQRRSRPRLPLPNPPPLPLHSGFGRASLTLIVRSPSCVPLSERMAFSPSSVFDISTKPKPRERPVSRSVMMEARVTAPSWLKSAQFLFGSVEIQVSDKNIFHDIYSDRMSCLNVGVGQPETRSIGEWRLEGRRTIQTRSEYSTGSSVRHRTFKPYVSGTERGNREILWSPINFAKDQPASKKPF